MPGKIIIFSIVFFLSVKLCFSGSDNTGKKDDLKISFGYAQTIVHFNNSSLVKLELELFINKNLSVDYTLSGNFSQKNTFIHAPLGFVAGLALLSETRETDFSSYDYLILLLMIIPEGVNYYIPMNDNINLVSYINPLGYDYFADDYSISSSLGAKLELLPLDNFSINPYAGLKLFYSHNSASFGFETGLLVSIIF